RYFAKRQLGIYSIKEPRQPHFRVGLTVGKKIGNAVMRNQIKRYLRQAFHELESEINSEYDMIIIARQPTKHMGFSEIKSSLIHLLSREKLFKSRQYKRK